MNKVILSILAVIIFNMAAGAQILTPVTWSYGAKRINKNEAVVFIKAAIEPGWHVYSQFVKDGGPVKTSFIFDHSAAYSLIGSTIEPRPVTRAEKAFNMNVSFFEGSVIFEQKIKLKGPTANVTGKLEYMTCNDKQCLPPDDIVFNIPVK